MHATGTRGAPVCSIHHVWLCAQSEGKAQAWEASGISIAADRGYEKE
jgi:hypothetical protein